MTEHYHTVWTKDTLVTAINQRVDRGELQGEYLFRDDITDAALQQFQGAWNDYYMIPQAREQEIRKLYQAIVAGF